MTRHYCIIHHTEGVFQMGTLETAVAVSGLARHEITTFMEHEGQCDTDEVTILPIDLQHQRERYADCPNL